MGLLKSKGPNPHETNVNSPRYTEASKASKRATEMGISGDAATLLGRGFERVFIQSDMEFKTEAGDFAYIGNRVGMVTAVTKNVTTQKVETITVVEDLGALPLDWRATPAEFGYDDNGPGSTTKTTTYAIDPPVAREVINSGGLLLTTGKILICRKRTADKTTWTPEAQAAALFQAKFDPPAILEYNFDLTSPNWAYEGVTDEASFINWLATRNYNDTNNLTNIVVTDFNFVGDRIFCNMTADGTIYELSMLGLVNADKIGVINGLTTLGLHNNLIVTFNPTIPLPNTLTTLYLTSNRMTLSGYTASEVWANSQPAFTNPCNVRFNNNTDSISGTNLEAILLTKNCVISA